jgi:hypothetical protein
MDWIDASPLVVKNLEEVMDYVWSQLSDKVREEFTATQPDALWRYHHGLGRAIRNVFGLWEEQGSSVGAYFEQVWGLTQPDDISHVIIKALHARANGTDYDIAADVEMLKEHYETFNMTDGKND